MSKIAEKIAVYFRKGLYRKAHLEVLESMGVITAEERQTIEKGE